MLDHYPRSLFEKNELGPLGQKYHVYGVNCYSTKCEVVLTYAETSVLTHSVGFIPTISGCTPIWTPTEPEMCYRFNDANGMDAGVRLMYKDYGTKWTVRFKIE